MHRKVEVYGTESGRKYCKGKLEWEDRGERGVNEREDSNGLRT